MLEIIKQKKKSQTSKMSLSVPHVRAQGDVLVRGHVVVDEDTEDNTAVAGAIVVENPVDTGLILDLNAEQYNPGAQGWFNLVTTGPHLSFQVLDPSTLIKESIKQRYHTRAGIVESQHEPSYLRLSGAQKFGFSLPEDNENPGFSWELIIWPESHPPTTTQYLIWNNSIKLIFEGKNEGEGLNEYLAILFREHNNEVVNIRSEVNLRDFAVQGCWNHVVLTYDGDNLIIYWNGIVKLNETRGPPHNYNTPQVLQISRAAVPGNQFKGNFSRVRHYYHVLNADEVMQNYAYYNKYYLFGGDRNTNSPPTVNL